MSEPSALNTCDRCGATGERLWYQLDRSLACYQCHTLTQKPAQEKDAINPNHYKADPSGVECIQVTRHRNFNIGNAMKYLWRLGLKDIAPSAEDLRKAIWYLEDELGRIEGNGTHAGQKKDG